MKLRNKKTSEIVELIEIVRIDDISNEFYLRLSDKEGRTFKVGINSLAELNEVWEDYEETKEYFYIYADGDIYKDVQDDLRKDNGCKEIGNYFETKEEAEKAVEKLKAWKRLKDGGITFKNWTINQTGTIHCFATWGDNIPPSRKNPTLLDDLDLLFGGEE